MIIFEKNTIFSGLADFCTQFELYKVDFYTILSAKRNFCRNKICKKEYHLV